MNYYLVKAKLGHVGRGKYLEVDFPVYAESKKTAAQYVLRKGKVKKHLKNAITSVEKLIYSEYIFALEEFEKNEFIHTHYSNEVDMSNYNIQSLEKRRKYKIETEFSSREERVQFHQRKEKIFLKGLIYGYSY